MIKAVVYKLSEHNATMRDLSKVYQRPLLRYFLRQGLTTSDANDFVQDVFTRVISKSDILGLENPQGYIFTIASNLLKNQARKHRSTQQDLHQEESQVALFCERPLQRQSASGRTGT